MGETTTNRPRVLAIDDEPDLTAWMQAALETNGYEVRTACGAGSAERIWGVWQPDLVLLDLLLPDGDGLQLLNRFRETWPSPKVIVVSGCGSIGRAVEAMQAGAASFLEKPVEAGTLLATIERAGVERNGEGAATSDQPATDDTQLDEMIATGPRMAELFEMIRLVAPTQANVLIVGENGTGKELVATAIHRLSRRSVRPFVRINCAAIPADLIESELFGHKRGSFTGAVSDKVGLFETAEGGSLLLDEIAEMAMPLQVKLLRVLQEKEFRAVGGNRLIKADFRLICSTNVPPEKALEAGKLREDLYFRINTMTMHVPPLRDRPEDIGPLALHFLRRYAAREGRDVRGIDAQARKALARYRWPGNVRELEHVMERAAIVASGADVTREDLSDSLHDEGERAAFVVPADHTLAELERVAILQTLERTRWNKRATASILGLHRPTLYSKLKKYGIGSEDLLRARRGSQGPH
ncbi:MAG: sigma-54-dependent transcriptional regulator [Vicinamibacteraceae bacterium]